MAACEAIAVAIEEYDKMETISFEAFERFPRDQKPEAPEIFFGRRAPALQLATSQALSFVIDHAERLPQLVRLPKVSRVLAELRGSGSGRCLNGTDADRRERAELEHLRRLATRYGPRSVVLVEG